MMKMVSSSLPTLNDCIAVLQRYLNGLNETVSGSTDKRIDDETSSASQSLSAWRKLVHQCLSHGTKGPDLCSDVDANKAPSISANAAGMLIASVLEWYLVQQQRQQSYPQHDDPVVLTVVDALWVFGCLLDTGATAPSTEPYQDLLTFINHLNTPRPWKTIDTSHPPAHANKELESQHPLIPIQSLQTSLEFSLLDAANLLPHPPPLTSSVTPSQTNKNMSKSKQPMPELETPMMHAKSRYMKVIANMYYRQKKFNILAEESEGYAKLLSFFFLYSDNQNEPGVSEKKSTSSIMVEDADDSFRWARFHVCELIGAFDLDPNRVLDLALDALEWNLNAIVERYIKQNMISSVAISTSSFTDVSNIEADDGSLWGLQTVRLALKTKDSIATTVLRLLSIIRELDGKSSAGYEASNNDTHGHQGRAIAHLLGFKYRSYSNRAGSMSVNTATTKQSTPPGTPNQSANPSANSSVYPRSLYLSTAFLCAHDLLDPHALLPHVVPLSFLSTYTSTGTGKSGEKANVTSSSHLMDLFYKRCTEAITHLKKLGVISLNAKSNADLAKDDNIQTKSDDTSTDLVTNDPVIGIFRSLLAVVGDWDTAVAFLAHATEPKFLDALNSAASSDDIGSMIRTIMSSVALAACSLSEVVALDVIALVSSTVEEIHEHSRFSSIDSGKMESPFLFPLSRQQGRLQLKYKILHEVSSVLLGPLSSLSSSGKICLSQTLYIKLCHLYRGRLSMNTPPGEGIDKNGDIHQSSIDEETFAVFSTFLVPSLSLFPSDPALSRELWSVLQLLPYSMRYKLYSSWRHPALEKAALRCLTSAEIKKGILSKPLGIIESEIKTGTEARSVMKRISKENIRSKGMELSRTSHNNPLVVFSYILNQIESYDNMILMMVDTFQFVTALGLDVMGFCLLSSLGGNDVGAGQRSRTKSGGLDTEQWLASLVTFTGAFYKKFPDVEVRGLLLYLTQRLAKGHASELDVLRCLIKTAGGYGFVDYDSTTSLSELQLEGRCGSRLLRQETSSFGVIDDINPKASRQLRSFLQKDDLGIIILILLSQVRSQILFSKSERKEHIKVLGKTYDGCESVLCLLLEYLSDSSNDQPSGPSTKEKFANSMPPLTRLCSVFGIETAVAWMLCRPLVRKSLFYMDDNKLVGKANLGEPPAFLKPFTPSPEMTASYQSLLPDSAWKHISPALFEAFYALSIYDIQCPSERYDAEINRLKKDCERLTHLQKGGFEAKGAMAAMAQAAAAAGGNEDEIRRATEFTKSHAMELDRLKQNVEQLSKDFARQQKRCEIVHAKLEAQKESLILLDEGDNKCSDGTFSSAFITFCVYPRCLLSPEDALFCAHFLMLLHKMKVRGFSIIQLIDDIVSATTGSFYCVTEDEAGNMAIFLHEIWKSINSWRYDNDSFASELKDTPGTWLSKQFALENSIGEHSVTEGITHEDYKKMYSKWHLRIGSAAVGCLNSSEYMHTRSALIVLSRIVFVYPTQPKWGNKILEILSSLQSDDNPRPDIRTTAQAYAAKLMKARDEGMWKEENISVTKARQEREKMKVEERRKKLAQQHEEMKKENEMINKEIGDNQRRRGGRDERGRPWSSDIRIVNPRAQHLNPTAPKFTPRDGGEARELNSTSHRRDGYDNSRFMDSRRLGSDRDTWERDRSGTSNPTRHNDLRETARPLSTGVTSDVQDNRRHGEDIDGSRRKRSRSPEPGEDTERENPLQKRYRQNGRSSSPSNVGRNSDLLQSNRGPIRRQDKKGLPSRH